MEEEDKEREERERRKTLSSFLSPQSLLPPFLFPTTKGTMMIHSLVKEKRHALPPRDDPLGAKRP